MRIMIVASLLLASAMPGITGGDVPLTEWCESAGIPGVVEKLAAEGFGTLAEVIEAELTADDLEELGLDADEAEKFTAAFAAANAPPIVQLSTWLAELDLADSLGKFEAEGFTTLPEVVEAELTEDDLKELGLGMKARKLIAIELAKLQETAAAADSASAGETKTNTMPQIQMDDIIILPNGGQMDGPNAWGTIIQTAKRKPAIETMTELDGAIRESHEGFGKMGGSGDLVLATPTGIDIKTMHQAKATGPPPTVYVRNEDDNWVWPGVQVGHRQKISLPVSEFYDMDAPSGGFSEGVPEELWSPPPEMSEADIEKAHEEAAKREEEEIARRAKANRSKRARRKAKKDKELADKASMAELAAKEGSDRREADFVIETLSTVPKVLRVRKFLSPTESAALRQLAAKQEMKDIVKQGPPGCEDSDTGCDVFRNETITWLAPTFGHWTVVPPYAPEPLIAGINRRAAALMKLDKKMMEGMLVTQSKASQHFWPHPDFHNAMQTEDPYDVGFYEDETINKFATLTTFLNDPSTDGGKGGFKSGGEMQFPIAGSYPPDAQKGCPPNMGVACGDAFTIQEFSAARAASSRAGDWVNCDKGLRIAPEAGTLIIHYNMPALGHQQGAVDPNSFNAQCDVIVADGDDDAAGAWRLTMPFASRMPEKPLEQTPGSFPPPKPNTQAAGGGGSQGGKAEIKDEETKSGWF